MAHRSKKKHLKHVRQHGRQQPQGSRHEQGSEDSASRSRTQRDEGPRDLDEGGERTGTGNARTNGRTPARRIASSRGARAGGTARKAHPPRANKPGLVRTIARAATRALAATPRRLLSKATGRVVTATSRATSKATRRASRATGRVKSMLGRET